MTDDSMRALRDAKPHAEEAADEVHHALYQEIVSSGRSGAPTTRGRAYRRWGIAGVAASAVAVGVLAAVFALTAPSPGTRTATPSAYAEVISAVNRLAAAGDSGTLTTSLKAVWENKPDAHLQLYSVLNWNGNDIALAVSAPGATVRGTAARSLYVGGKFYEQRDGKWLHYKSTDERNPGASWAAGAKRETDGDRIREVVSVLKDLDERSGEDGATVYTGWATAKQIDDRYRDENGLPWVSRPFPKLGNPDAQVKVEITVGADGVLKSVAYGYNWDNAQWLYKCDYSRLGSTPKIDAPNPSNVVETNGARG